MYVCMYVYMHRGCPLWSCPLLWALQLRLGEGPIGIVGPVSQPRGTINTVSRTLDHIYALNVRFLNQLYSRQPVSSCRRYSDTPGLRIDVTATNRAFGLTAVL